jgi:hypothetical protein
MEYVVNTKEVVDKEPDFDVKYPDEIYEVIPKEKLAKFKKNGDIE